MKKCSIIISSCDPFSDLWKPFFYLFFKYWPDCPFPIYLVSENKTFDDNRVVAFTINDPSFAKTDHWAEKMKMALDFVDTPYIIFFQEDYFLKGKVKTEKILEYLRFIDKNPEIGCIRLSPTPPPSAEYTKNKNLGLIQRGDNYYVSLQSSIWRSSVFNELLIKGESFWDIEIKGGKRAENFNTIFLSVKKDSKVLPYYVTAVKKGVMLWSAKKLLEKEKIDFVSDRKIESFFKYVMRKSKVSSFISRLKRLPKKIMLLLHMWDR